MKEVSLPIDRYLATEAKLGLSDISPIAVSAYGRIYAREIVASISGKSESVPGLPTGLKPFDYEKLPEGAVSLVVGFGGSNAYAAFVEIDREHNPQIRKAESGAFMYVKRPLTKEYKTPADFYKEFGYATEDLLAISGGKGVEPSAVAVINSFEYKKVGLVGNNIDLKPKLSKGIVVPHIERTWVGVAASKSIARVKRRFGDLPYTVNNDATYVAFKNRVMGGKIGAVAGTGMNVGGYALDAEVGQSHDIIQTPRLLYLIAKKYGYDNVNQLEWQVGGKYLVMLLTEGISLLYQDGLMPKMYSKGKGSEIVTNAINLISDDQAIVELFDKKQLSPANRGILTSLARTIRYRAGEVFGLVNGAYIAAFPHVFPGNGLVTIPVEGSVARYMSGFLVVAKKTAQMVAGRPIEFAFDEFASIKGAGAVAIAQTTGR